MGVIEFDYMFYDTVASHVFIDTNKDIISIKDFVDDPVHQFCGKRPHTIDTVLECFEEHCFSKERPDKEKILKSLGLTQYNPLDIIKVTHGVLINEPWWFKFKGEDDLCWDMLDPYKRDYKTLI